MPTLTQPPYSASELATESRPLIGQLTPEPDCVRRKDTSQFSNHWRGADEVTRSKPASRMRVPSKAAIQKIVTRHRKKKARISKRAAAEVYFFYLIFLKRLAKDCDADALGQNKLVIGEDMVRKCAPKLVKSLSFIETLKTTLPPELVKEMVSNNSDDEDELTLDEEQYD